MLGLLGNHCLEATPEGAPLFGQPPRSSPWGGSGIGDDEIGMCLLWGDVLQIHREHLLPELAIDVFGRAAAFLGIACTPALPGCIDGAIHEDGKVQGRTDARVEGIQALYQDGCCW